MNKQIWLAAGICGMLLCNPNGDSKAEINVRVGDLHIGVGERGPSFVIETRPTFIYLQDMGFSVAVGSPYDMLYYGDLYYIYRDGYWYSSSYFRGPWIIVREDRLPRNIRRHRWDEIRRYRDVEYRKHDRRYWEERDRHPDKGRRDDRRSFEPPRAPEPPRPQEPQRYREQPRPQEPVRVQEPPRAREQSRPQESPRQQEQPGLQPQSKPQAPPAPAGRQEDQKKRDDRRTKDDEDRQGGRRDER
ncbi:MAG: hypothetical protein WCH05_04005 [Chlorobiaceae bacterium]